MSQSQDIQELKEKLDEMFRAGLDAARIFEQLNDEDMERAEEPYPFPIGFYDLVYDIAKWKDKIRG